MNELSGNKKILLSVSAFVLVMIAVIGVLFILGAKSDEMPENSDRIPVANSEYEDISAEILTSAQMTTSPAMNTEGVFFSEAEAAIMNAYTSGNYYLSGEIHSGGSVTPIDLAMSGKNFHTTTEMDGLDMGVMYLNGKVYFINNDEKKYIDFDSIASLMGGSFDFDMSELDQISESMDMTKYSFRDVEKTETQLGSETATCYRFYGDEMSLYFYFVSNELRQIDLGSPQGEIASSTVVDTFSIDIPYGMLSLSGLSRSSIFEFFGEEYLVQY